MEKIFYCNQCKWEGYDDELGADITCPKCSAVVQEVCVFCYDTGEVPVFERDADSGKYAPVGKTPCICKSPANEDMTPELQ